MSVRTNVWGVISVTGLALTVAGCGTMGQPAQEEAAQQQIGALPDFDALDVDDNGVLSRDEVAATPVNDIWDNIDADGNDELDAVEFSAFEQGTKPPDF